MPSPYPNHPISPQPSQNYDQIIHQTTSQHLTTLPDIISHPINHNHAVYIRPDAGTPATVPNYILYNGQNNDNNHNIRTNSKGIFMPVSTNQYPIEQSSMDADFGERFVNFLDQWMKAFMYLSRK